ncbi:site-2 protease family protein [Arthrospiribacter ruber]|uniref:Site-2 protease family protein n=1 Tax=Arthrospiribacter ruber TaxID=2487934 RepID=A0A951MEW5_9BACT|nr:site-2 protease family protein [Arthrospiribacter ruber]MBW3468201.1 site-2 protease family protein [Arthrospiribacter ruber]
MYSKKEYLKHLLLFILTLFTATLAGGEWLFGRSILGKEEHFLNWEYFIKSLHFSVPFIGILLIHELGHLFTSIYHKVRSSLPYFIPGWLGFLGAPSIGTFGAVIQVKSFINSRRKYFDIGIAGPLAGFVLAVGVLWYGFTHLPDADYIYQIHPEYLDPDFEGHSAEEGYINLEIGYNILFWGMEKMLADPDKMPVMSEIIHFPYLFAGYLALFFTALNLLPIGQLDGGHIIFGLFPKNHKMISLIAYTAFMFYAGLGLINPFQSVNELLIRIPLYIGFLYVCYRKVSLPNQTKWTIILCIVAVQYATVNVFPQVEGYSGWLLFGLLLGRLMGIEHPEVSGFKPLNRQRQVLGWIAILIFCICFMPQPFVIE